MRDTTDRPTNLFETGHATEHTNTHATEPASPPAAEAPASSPDDRSAKHRMIDAIRQRNRSAQPDFLAGFDERTLETYLQRLTHLANRRGRDSVWVRDGSTRAMDTGDSR